MITSQQAINKTIEIVSAAFPSVSGEAGSSHFYGDIQIDEHLFVKFRVADHGIYIQTLISHSNGIPPELKETISIVYRNSTTEPIGTKTTTKGYKPTIAVMQYVYPCWDMYIPDVVVVANEIISFLKTGEFKPEYAGKLNFYLSAVDGILKKESDNPTIGLLLCKSKNNVIAEYSLKDVSKPIGVSEYKVTGNLPKELAEQLPSVEDIQKHIQ